MSLGTQTAQLWKRSRPFRLTTIAAGLVSVLAVVSGVGSGGSQSAGMSNSNQGGGIAPPSSTPQTPPGTQQQALVKCGPGGSTQLAAPIVQGSSQPQNVTAVQPAPSSQGGGIPLDVVGRFNQFSVIVDAAKSEPRRGESCALMSDAIIVLQPTDFAYAACFQDGQTKLTDAQACAQSHGQSEARYEDLIAAHSAFVKEPSSANVAALARAQSEMRDYDKARERWREVTSIISEAQTATASIAQSDARIAQLVAAARAAQSGAAPQIQALADAGGLSQLDIARLTPEQSDMLEAARKARTQVQDSDTRLDTLAVALQSVISGSNEARADLIAAVGALSPFDSARASASQASTIERAKSEAARFALDDLVAEAEALGVSQLGTASPEQHQRLVDLATVVNEHGGVTEPTAAQTAALTLSREAEAALARSDRRIKAMSDTIATVRAGGPSAINDDVLKSYDAITDFDQKRMNDSQRADYISLENAREVSVASEARVLTRSVPIFVSAQGDGPLEDAVQALSDGLQRDGFNLVSSRDASAVHLVLRVGELRERENSFGGTTVKTARIEIGLGGKWTVADSDMLSSSAEGIGRGRDAQREALDAALDELLEAVRAAAEKG